MRLRITEVLDFVYRPEEILCEEGSIRKRFKTDRWRRGRGSFLTLLVLFYHLLSHIVSISSQRASAASYC
jgi:hypothetical protein